MAIMRHALRLLVFLSSVSFKEVSVMTNFKNVKKLTHALIVLGASSILFSCGQANEEQDGLAMPVDNSVIVTGLAMNGYLANALVWLDFRANGSPDGFEPFAYTDSEGFISYNPNTGVNYCESSEPSFQRFCLRSGSQSGNVTLKATKGVELLSGESFRSVLSATLDLENMQDSLSALQGLGPRPLGDTSLWQRELDTAMLKISPLSSLAAYLPEERELSSVLMDAGFDIPPQMSSADVLSIDYIAGVNNESLNREVSAELFAAALLFSRLVDTISVNLDQASDDIDLGLDGLPISTADAAYQGIASSLASSSTTPENGFVVSQASTETRNVVANVDIESALRAAVGNLLNVLSQSDVLSISVQSRIDRVASDTELTTLLSNVGNTALNHFNDIAIDDDLVAQMLTLNQTVTLPTLTEAIAFASTQDARVINTLSSFMADPDNRVTEILSQASQAFVEQRGDQSALTLTFDLNSLTQDLLVLAQDDESGLASEENEVVLSQLAQVETVEDTSFWAGNSLSLSGVQDDNEEGQTIVFFNGAASDNSGELIMCIAYRNQSKPSDNISGQRFEGSWAVLGGDAQNRLSLVAEGFSIQMKVLGETRGSEIPLEQQIPSLPRMPNELYGKYGFTLNEDTATWHSDDASINQSFGLQFSNTTPQSDDDCRDILALRAE